MPETFHKSMRGSRLRSASHEVPVEDGYGAALLEALRAKGERIGDIGGLSLVEPKLFMVCFATGIFRRARWTYATCYCFLGRYYKIAYHPRRRRLNRMETPKYRGDT